MDPSDAAGQVTQLFPPIVQISAMALAAVGLAVWSVFTFFRAARSGGGDENSSATALEQLRVLGAAFNDREAIREIADMLRQLREQRELEADREQIRHDELIKALGEIAEAVRS